MKFKKYVKLEVGDVIFVAGTGVVYKVELLNENFYGKRNSDSVSRDDQESIFSIKDNYYYLKDGELPLHSIKDNENIINYLWKKKQYWTGAGMGSSLITEFYEVNPFTLDSVIVTINLDFAKVFAKDLYERELYLQYISKIKNIAIIAKKSGNIINNFDKLEKNKINECIRFHKENGTDIETKVYFKDDTSEDYENLSAIIEDYINNAIRAYELELINVPKKD